jgi:hypothetical protein
MLLRYGQVTSLVISLKQCENNLLGKLATLADALSSSAQ